MECTREKLIKSGLATPMTAFTREEIDEMINEYDEEQREDTIILLESLKRLINA